MRKLKINRTDFELAFTSSSDETTAFLDTETGAVIFIEDYVYRQLEELLSEAEETDDIEAVLLAQTYRSDDEWQSLLEALRIERDFNNRYRLIPRQDSRDGYREMQEYIWALEDERLRELLDVAIQGSGAFRRFKDVLARYPEARAEWFRFRDEREAQRMMDWFASVGIEPDFA